MPLTSEEKRAGVVGTGIIRRHLMAAGWPPYVFNRTREKATPLVDAGARWEGTPGDAAAEADVVLTMLDCPADVEEVYLDSGRLIECAPPGTVLIATTTSSPSLAVRIAEAASASGRPERLEDLEGAISYC